MNIVFLESCRHDLDWLQNYYSAVFPGGHRRAYEQYERAKTFLRHNPYIGHHLEEAGLREFQISRTQFSFVYRIKDGVIEIVRVWDQRAKRPEKWT